MNVRIFLNVLSTARPKFGSPPAAFAHFFQAGILKTRQPGGSGVTPQGDVVRH